MQSRKSRKLKRSISAALAAVLLLMACGCGRQTEQAVEPVDAIGIIGAMEVEVASLKEAMEIASTKTVANEEAAAVRCAAIVRYIVSTL